MMETKLWFALCALLLVNLGTAEHGAPLTSALNTEAAPRAQNASSLNFTSHPAPALNGSDTNPSSNGTNTFSSNSPAAGETMSLTPEAKRDNATNILLGENNRTLVDKLTKQPPGSLKTPTNTSHILPTSTPTSPPPTAHNAPVNASNTMLPINAATSISSTSAHNQTEPPKPKTTTAATVSSASSTSTSRELPNSQTQTLTSPHVSQSAGTQAQTKPTISPPSSASAQTKDHANTPSQLNVGGETTMVHESPTLDPLLAGLVSAFIITAVIITILLFLKLRRRDNRPEFRRLQDLPMDDMMEDTPLSMYTY